MSYHPIIKTWTLLKYKNSILISTEPTEKGKKEIDVLHQFFPVKRIHKCKLDEFQKNYNYLLLEKAENLGLINVKYTIIISITVIFIKMEMEIDYYLC